MVENRYQNRVFTMPNALSAVRILLIPLFMALYAAKEYAWSAMALGVSGLTDMLDGLIARRFHMESNLGKILDPAADKLTQAAMCLMLLSRYSIMLWLLIFFAVKELAMVALGYCYMRRTGIVNSARWYGKASSIVQYAVILALLLMPRISDYSAHVLIALSMLSHAVSLGMYFVFYVRSIRNPSKEPGVAMRPIDWGIMVMYLLWILAIFMLLFTSGESTLKEVLSKPLYLFLRFASIVGTVGVAAFFLGEKIPRSWFNPEKFPFKSFKWENEGRIYEKIGIQHWKNRTPDMSKYIGRAFAKQGNLFRDPNHLRKLVAETCSAEAVHWVLICISPLFLILMEEGGALAMVLYVLGNLVSLVIQRYNRPRIMKIIQRIEKKNTPKG